MPTVFFLLLLSLVSNHAFARDLPAVQTYDQLLQAIRQTHRASQARIEAAVEQEKVREAWETGKLIDEHILFHKERADYGKQVVIRLAKDLGTSETELKYMLQFARTYPIRRPADELSWGHYESLLALNDPSEREEVRTQAVKEHWNRERIREEVRRRKAKELPELTLEEPKPGKVGTYRISKNAAGELFIDLGFSDYLKPEKKLKFKEGDIVELKKGKLKKSAAGESALFAYRGSVLNVLDGDTLRVEVELGFGFTTVQKLRLRGLDAPELVSAEGREAKEYVEKLLAGRSVLIKTVKSDKYDRYLADVWAGGTYLNQKLIEKHLAVPVSE